MSKRTVDKTNQKLSRVLPPANLVNSYKVTGGLADDLMLSVGELTQLESQYVVCSIIDVLKNVRIAIDSGNLATLIGALEGLKRYYKHNE